MDPAIGLVAKTLDLQGPAIDKFRATDLSEFADISLDPTGLLARTLPVPDKEATPIQNATYEQRGALQYQSDPARSAKLQRPRGSAPKAPLAAGTADGGALWVLEGT